MERLRLLSSIFGSKKSLSKEVQPMKEERCNGTPRGFQGGESCSETSRRFQEEEEDPCTSCSHRESGEQEGHLEHEILSGYLAEYKCQPRAFKETLDVPQSIQLREERRPCSKRMIRGNRFLLSTFDGSLKCATKTWVMKLEAFFLLHLVVEKSQRCTWRTRQDLGGLAM